MEESEQPPPKTTSSLFPVTSSSLFPVASSNNNVTQSESEWLRNQSFTTDISIINDAVSKYEPNLPPSFEDDDEEEEEVQPKHERPQYEFLNSSASDDNSGGEEKRKKKKKKRKRKESSETRPSYGYYGLTSRKPDTQNWTSSSSSSTKEYYFDSRGDKDNLAFGSIYRMNLARYKLYNSGKKSRLNHFHRGKEEDIDALDQNLRSNGRYWSTKYAVMERHKNFKRIHIHQTGTHTSSSPEFVPISEESEEHTVFEESWEEEMFRKTKEFNKITRESPNNETIWLDFANFQDKVASTQTQKGARLQTHEKKISILEKAIELNPESEELLLSLMIAYKIRDSTDVLISKWEKILLQNSGSYKLWREFLRLVQGEFSRFKVSEMRKIYANAIQALFGACNKKYRQVNQPDQSIIQLEVELVNIFISLCRFEWETGYKELSTALFQAEIEYSLFSPSLHLTENSKQRLFQHFWNSNGARIGENSALGWSNWLEKEEKERERVKKEELLNKVEVEGGWIGWSDPLNKDLSVNNESVEAIDEGVEDENVEENENDDTEYLMKMLGINGVNEGINEVKDVKTWLKWSVEEIKRDEDQWMPVRKITSEDAEEDEELLRVIVFEDVSDYLFSVNSEEAKRSLVSQFIDFYGGKIAQWTCTNSSTWAEKTLSLDSLAHTLSQNCKRGPTNDMNIHIHVGPSLEPLLDSSGNDIEMRINMIKFIRNASLLCLNVFTQKYKFQEAALIADELVNTRMDLMSCDVTPCRALAKSLLKSNRQDLLLCGVYAQREAVYGNIDLARKVFDLALTSLEGLSSDNQSNSSLLYLWYAEVEVTNSSIDRAVYILSCLGSNEKYSSYKSQVSSVQQLRARQGFKEKIKSVCNLWARGVVDDYSIALICSAALFEELSFGWSTAIDILDHAFTAVLPERRRQSYQLELLFNYYVEMLCKHHTEVNFSKLWGPIVKGLQIYPFSPYLYNALVKISVLHTSPNKLRWILDDICQKQPSVIVWLFALSFEMGKNGTQHRIRGLFEKALENEKLQKSVILWRSYIGYEISIANNSSSARKVFFRAIHACPWSKKLWFDGFHKLNSILSAKELSDLQEVMRDKEINLRTDIYEILLQDDDNIE